MAKYKYKAMNAKGERIEGTYEANSKDGVMQMISFNNYYPLLIEEIKEGNNFELLWMQKVSIKDIAIFCRQFYTMLDAGSSISNSIHILSTQIQNKKFKQAVSNIEDEVRKGSTLSDAMRLQRDIFPELLISMVATGELSGTLDSVMLRMAKHYEKEYKINNKIKNAMIYPLVLGVVALGVISFILTFVMPMFIDMFKDSGVELPLITRILLGLSGVLKSYGIFIFILIVCSAIALKEYLKKDKGKLFASKLKLKLPLIRRINEKIIVSRFTRTLATALSSGISLVQALDVVGGVIGNKVVEEALNRVREKVIKGEGLSEPIKETNIFPIMLSSMIKIGEESGSLDDILNKTADFYDDELENEINTITALLDPIMIAIMGVIIGFMIVAIITPMFSMYNVI